MVGVLEAMPRIKGKGLLFTTTGETPIAGMTKCKTRLHDAMARELGKEPERWVLHDLRRTFVTGLQQLGFPLEVAEAAVNHKGGTVGRCRRRLCPARLCQRKARGARCLGATR